MFCEGQSANNAISSLYPQELNYIPNEQTNQNFQVLRSQKVFQDFLLNIQPYSLEVQINMSVFYKYFNPNAIKFINSNEFPSFPEILYLHRQIIERSLLKSSQKRNWVPEEVIFLVWIVVRYCLAIMKDFSFLVDDDWLYISMIMPNKSKEICKSKWLSLFRTNLKERPWTAQEDSTLSDLKKRNQNKKWGEIALELSILTNENIFRTGKMCRERWNNYLNPNLKKTEWKNQEDIILFNFVKNYGKKWSKIAQKIQGRTENSVKNRYNSLIKKKSKDVIGVSFKELENNDCFEKNLIDLILIELQELEKNEINKVCKTSKRIKKKEVSFTDSTSSFEKKNILFELIKEYEMKPVKPEYYRMEGN